MTGKIGQIEGNRLWLRCPECGDSEHDPNKAHLNIDLTRMIFHCYRCGWGGKLSPKETIDLMAKYDIDIAYAESTSIEDIAEFEYPDLELGAGTSRRSALERFHLVDSFKEHWDAFQIFDPRDNVRCGLHLRKQRIRLTFGDPGFTWPNAGCESLKSSFRYPITIVEGPYDVLEPRDACLYGYYSYGRLRTLAGHYIYLYPDGDTWEEGSTYLFSRFAKVVQKLLHSKIYLMGFYVLPDGLDPDEFTGLRESILIPRESMLLYLEKHLQLLPSYLERNL